MRSRVDNVTTIELQRPGRQNALSVELADTLREAFNKAADDGVHVIALTGQGSVFCAGTDLSANIFAENSAQDLTNKTPTLCMAIERNSIPVIAAINGPAIGADAQLAMVCDLRVIAPNAYFQFPTSEYGFEEWTIRRLCSLVARGRARAILLGAKQLGASEAFARSMANPLGTVNDAQAWSRDIAALPPLWLRYAKRVLNDIGSQRGAATETHGRRE